MADPYADNVVLHLPLNEYAVAGSFLLPDCSTYRQMATRSGSAALSSAQSKFGGKSLAVPGGARVLLPLPLGAGDFTVEGWVRLTNVVSTQAIFSMNTASEFGVWLKTGKLAWWESSNYRCYSEPVSANSWIHVAVCRQAGVLSLFANGVRSVSTYATSTNYTVTDWSFGTLATGTYPMSGYLDDIRITLGVARYTADFTPPGEIEHTPWTVGATVGVLPRVKRLSPYEDDPTKFSALVPQAKTAVPDIHYGGKGQIVGTTKVKGAPDSPVARRVRLHRTRDGVAVRETWSDAAGNYTVKYLDMGETYYAVSFDHTGMYRGVVADGLVPVSM